MDDPVTLVDGILVYHPGFEEATRRIEQCYTFAHGASEPVCIALIGEARTGKSRVLETCLLNHPPRRLDDGMNVPIVLVKAPSKPTVKGLAEVMLEALRAPDPTYGTENERTRRLKTLMRGTQTQMLMIDEFQHFYDKGTKLIMHHVADWLKILVDDLRCALIVAGLPSCRAVIDQNEQLAGRFLAPVHLSRFRWNNNEEREDFKAILRSFYEALCSHFQISELHAEQMAFRFYCATGGLIGFVAKLLRQAVRNAVSESRAYITLEHLDVAHGQSMWREPGSDNVPRPFRSAFAPDITNEVLDQALRIGTVITPIYSAQRATRKPVRSANACLVAR